MANYYIYLPVYDLQLAKVARDWKRDSKRYADKDYEIIIRQTTGFKKWVSRKVYGGALKNIDPAATVYVLAHGYSAGKSITGPEAEARSLLSTFGSNYGYLKKHFETACSEVEDAGYADPKEGDAALEAALEDDEAYKAVVELFAKHVGDGPKSTITLERPGAIRIGGSRPDGSAKLYSPAELFRNLRKEGLPQVPKLKIFACNTGIIARNETWSFAEQLYELMKNDYPSTRVFGYLGAVNAGFGPQKSAKDDGKIPEKASEVWEQFHDSGGEYTNKRGKGVRIVRPTVHKVLVWGSSDMEQIPAHVLRVEFPGGQSIAGDMLTQENEAKPF